MSIGTPSHKIRMALALWKEFGEAAEEDGTNRSELVRRWVMKYLAERKKK